MIRHYPYIDYYFRWTTKQQLISTKNNREFAMLTMKGTNPPIAIRYLKVHTVSQMDSHIKCSGMKDKRLYYNFYRSVAKYHSEPFSYIGDKNVNEARNRWRENKGQNIYAYDLIIDIDAPSLEYVGRAGKDCYAIARYLQTNLNATFRVYYSGMGFHIVIDSEMIVPETLSIDKGLTPTENIYDGETENNIYKQYGDFARKLKDNFSEFIDSSIYDDKRVIKIPGTMAVYQDAPDGLITCGIKDLEHLRKFDYRSRYYEYLERTRKVDAREEAIATTINPEGEPLEIGKAWVRT